MQTQAMTGTYYKGMGDCISTVWKTEGVKAFYRGIAAPMSSYGKERHFLALWCRAALKYSCCSHTRALICNIVQLKYEEFKANPRETERRALIENQGALFAAL